MILVAIPERSWYAEYARRRGLHWPAAGDVYLTAGRVILRVVRASQG